MGELKFQEVDAFFLGCVVPQCGTKMQTQTGLILKFMPRDHHHQLLGVVAAASRVLFCLCLKRLLHLTGPLSSAGVTRGSGGEGRVELCP